MNMHTTSPRSLSRDALKKQLLKKRLKHAGNTRKPDTKPVQRRQNQTHFPLSFAQQRLWFLEQFEGGHATYNVPFHATLTGPLHVPVLEHTLNEILRRHEVLRTWFEYVEDRPMKRMQPELTISLPVRDLRDLSEAERDAEIRRRKEKNVLPVFDLSQCPLFRVELLRTSEQEYLLLLTIHHILYDGWSINVLMHELQTLYTAFEAGDPSPLDELPLQYADFAQWQKTRMTGDVQEEQLAYWRKKLHGALPTLDLPSDYPRPAEQTFHGATFTTELPEGLCAKLKTLSRTSHSTQAMTMMGAFATLLFRYTGQEDISLGSPVANRLRQEFEPLIGFFVNTLVMRTDLSGDPTFYEVVERVRQTSLEAQDHQEVPFDMLVEELRPPRDVSHTPFFQVMFAFQNVQMQEFRLGKQVKLKQEEFHNRTAKFDLTLEVITTKTGAYLLSFEYNTDLFHPATIERMAGHLETLLQGIALTPRKRISEFPILPEAERKRLLVEWNDTITPYPREKCIHELFEEQVAQTPDSIAVVCGEEHLTYQELNRRANQLARNLQNMGVKPGDRVGISMERSLEMIIGLFGILKAGGTYIPLDPEYPQERLAFMLEDSQAAILLTQQSLKSELPTDHARILCLDTEWHMIAKNSDENVASGVTSDHLIYVIYTSGSTGKPKGAGVYHRSFTNLVNWFVTHFDIYSDDSVLLISSFNFDLTQKNMYAPLIRGGCLYLPQSKYYEPAHIIQLIQHQRISWVNCTPSAFHALLESSAHHGFRELEPLRYVFLGGEPISIPNLLPWSKSDHFHATIVNTYGPTECTDISNSYIIKTPEEFLEKPVPIGKPIFNVQVMIVDRHHNLVPVGVTGELCITGESVGIGYINNPKLTDEKFIQNPYTAQKEPRLYKTGDLARYLADGNIEFLGRIDHQVKIRGFRIELEEIEALLDNHPDIKKVVVMARETSLGDTQLIAYIVQYVPHALTTNDVRKYLKKELPDYMIPSAFVFLDTFLLTPNGKIDRRALPEPDKRSTEKKNEIVAPTNDMETIIAKIWTDIMERERISIHDNFFDMGGHSLLAIQIVTQLSHILNQTISVKTLFQHPTIHKLAQTIETEPSVSEPGTVMSEPVKKPAVPQEKALEKTTAPLFQFEHRPLLSLVAAGKIAQLDGIALDYFTTPFIENLGIPYEEVIYRWCNNFPTLWNISKTNWGRIGVIMLPLYESRLFREKETLINNIIEALEIAKWLGVSTVSLTGILPNITDYGQAIMKAIGERSGLPQITTGYGVITSAYLLNIKQLLQVSGRNLTSERIAFLGLGAIGVQILKLMLKCLPQPKEIILCDRQNKSDFLKMLKQELIKNFNFWGKVRISEFHVEDCIPSDLLDATLLINTMAMTNILDITGIKAGTLIVNPRCFNMKHLFLRIQEHQDILFTLSNILKLPNPIEEIAYLPYSLKKKVNSSLLEEFYSKCSHSDIPACSFASLLPSYVQDIKPTLGKSIDMNILSQYYETLEQLKIQGTKLHIGNVMLSETAIRSFSEHFNQL